MTHTKLTTPLVGILLALGGCGGGGDDAPPTVASTSVFAVSPAMATIYSAGLNLNVAGPDNSTPPSNLTTNQRNDYQSWSGTFSASQRAPSAAFLDSTPNCATATMLVDVNLVAVRARDGYRMQEAATFGYGSNYKPVCALTLDGHYWTWNLSEPLPASSTVNSILGGVQFTGTISRTPEATQDIDSRLTSLVGLDPDTANSAWLSFTYHVVSNTSTMPFRMFGENTQMRFRIDPTGKLLGFQYLRTGALPDLSAPNTNYSSTDTMLVLNAQ
jgi:hypothetical protein